MSVKDRRPIFVVIGLAVLVLALFGQVRNHEFIAYDDNDYVTRNPVIREGLTGRGVVWAFTRAHSSNWHPLTWLSHMADVELFGLDAGKHHLVSVAFHAANAALLYLVLWRMTGFLWRGAFVAALFALHPLHVESVAWVAERKDLLSAFFWILTLLAYLGYVRRPGVVRYLAVILFFALGLMSKPMVVTLPFVILLMDYWPLGRFASADASASLPGRFSVSRLPRLLLEKVPLLGLSAVSCVVTYVAHQRGESVSPLEVFPVGARVANAVVSYGTYLWKMCWPSSLAVFYPRPSGALSAAELLAAGSVLAIFSIAAIRLARRRPYLPVGWFWYLGTLVPVIGLVQVGEQAMADRYTYIPLIGVFVAIAWGASEWLGGRRLGGRALGVAGAAVLAALASAAWFQAGHWQDTKTLSKHALRVTANNWMAWLILGDDQNSRGEYAQALQAYRQTLLIKPDVALAWNNMGVAYSRLGAYRQAIEACQRAVGLKPRFAEAWYNLAVIQGSLGNEPSAIGAYRQALRIKPDYGEAWYNLGVIRGNLGDYRNAVEAYTHALNDRPDLAQGWNNLGVAYKKLGYDRQAVDAFRAALRLAPDDALAWHNLGAAHRDLGQFPEAIEAFGRALRISPDYADAWSDLGVAYAMLGQRGQAREVYERLRRIDPARADALKKRIDGEK